jgi:hypothetical protein
MKRRPALAALVAVALAAAPAVAEPRRPLLLAPLATLGSESSAADVKRSEKLLAKALASLDDISLIPTSTALTAIKKAKRNELRACEGEAACLAALGGLVQAELVVYGELGGLGDAQVVYLKLIDVATGREIRSTTLELGSDDRDSAARAGATRLIAPGRYVGTLTLAKAPDGATVYVDGEKQAGALGSALRLPVGTHAVRVTHPEYRDFVRFIDIGFGEDSHQDVELSPFAVVASDIHRQGGAGRLAASGDAGVVYNPTPWYRRWTTIAGAGAVVFIGSAIVFGALAGGVDADREKPVR